MSAHYTSGAFLLHCRIVNFESSVWDWIQNSQYDTLLTILHTIILIILMKHIWCYVIIFIIRILFKKTTITFNCILLQCTEETQCQRRMAELWGGVLLSNNKRTSNQRIFCDVIFNLKQNTRLKCTFKGSYSCAVTVTVGGCLVMFCVTSA